MEGGEVEGGGLWGGEGRVEGFEDLAACGVRWDLRRHCYLGVRELGNLDSVVFSIGGMSDLVLSVDGFAAKWRIGYVSEYTISDREP